MAKKKRLIIPVFIPFGGCPHQCVFCDQAGITGSSIMPDVSAVEETIEAYLSTWEASGGRGPREVAFYGGSFTGLDRQAQALYLETAHRSVKQGRIDSVRLSTRPDYMDAATAAFLAGYDVAVVELGAQSMSDEVLRLSGRGHTAAETKRAVEALKEASIETGLQLMPGLPGDTPEIFIQTVRETIALAPGFVRIYPTLVLKGTPLNTMFERGEYKPWPLDKMVGVCKEAAALLNKAGVPVIRMGLQPTEELGASLVAGPYHPSFRQLVEGAGATPST